ncbi:HNH endonuclease [Streptomyces sp. sk226]|uniref:HNH endonuclease n=1 Tax=Streptomyces sp. sk226 TaxID=2034268 RepID=UPI000BEFF49B|nr:HNH endonuclease [Streptomyces sp. sk226]
MPVTKRLRYEVMRRDNYTCRYCGAAAPSVKLTIDHVIPQALGGPDEPANLVAACEDCNSGKTSTPADSPIVTDVTADAVRWSVAMQKAAEASRADFEVAAGYREVFLNAWTTWGRTLGSVQRSIPLDPTWQSTLDTLRTAGLPDWELEEAVRSAMSQKRVTPENTFRYFCGICWKKVRSLHDRAAEILTATDSATEREEGQEQDRIATRCQRGVISSPQADPISYLWEANSAFFDAYMSIFYLDQECRSIEGLDLLEFGDDMAQLIQMVGLTLGEWAGSEDLEKRFRQGRDWSGAAALVAQAFELMRSEQWPHQESGGLTLPEIRDALADPGETAS